MAAFQCPVPGVNQPVARERTVIATQRSSFFFSRGDNEVGKTFLTLGSVSSPLCV